MEFDLNDTQRMMQQAARTYLTEECPSQQVRRIMAAATPFDEALWRGLAEQGWLGIVVPERCGGLGLGAVELAAVMEEVGRACVPSPLLGTIWGAETLATANSAGCRKLLEEVVAGSRRLAVLGPAFSAVSHGDLASEPLALRQAGAGYVLSGTARLALDAAAADTLVVAVTGEDSASGDWTLLAVPANRAGIERTAASALDPTRSLADVRLAAVSVKPDEVIAVGDAAQAAWQRGAALATVALCADLVGAMQWMLAASVEYVQTRQQFGKPIGSFQAVQQHCADMLLWLESARSATWYAAWAHAVRADGAANAVAVAKGYASRAAREVANRAVQVHGGVGFTWEHDLQLYYKRATSGELLLGNSAWHAEQLAGQLWGPACAV